MDKQTGSYRRGGAFLIAATVVALVLAYAVHAPMAAMIAIGVFGLGGGVALIVFGERKPKE